MREGPRAEGRGSSGLRRADVVRAAGFRAFTLVEIIVVIVMLGILAGLVVPRMMNTADRQADAEARAVERLVSIAAERVGVAGEAVAIEFDSGGDAAAAPGGKLSVLVQRTRAGAPGKAGAASGGEPTPWRVDGLIEPVTLSAARMLEARADGVVLDGRRWRVVLRPGQARAALEMRVGIAGAGAAGGPNSASVIRLGAGDVRATRDVGGGGGAGGVLAIDLDDAGRGTKAW